MIYALVGLLIVAVYLVLHYRRKALWLEAELSKTQQALIIYRLEYGPD